MTDSSKARGKFFGFGEYAPDSAMGRVAVAGVDFRIGERLGAPDPRSDGTAEGQ
jgi:hypothetical protein